MSDGMVDVIYKGNGGSWRPLGVSKEEEPWLCLKHPDGQWVRLCKMPQMMPPKPEPQAYPPKITVYCSAFPWKPDSLTLNVTGTGVFKAPGAYEYWSKQEATALIAEKQECYNSVVKSLELKDADCHRLQSSLTAAQAELQRERSAAGRLKTIVAERDAAQAEVERLLEALELIAAGSDGFTYREYIGPNGESVSETDDAHKVARAALAQGPANKESGNG